MAEAKETQAQGATLYEEPKYYYLLQIICNFYQQSIWHDIILIYQYIFLSQGTKKS